MGGRLNGSCFGAKSRIAWTGSSACHRRGALANGLPSFTLVGLADTEVKEAHGAGALRNLECGSAIPHNQRITVNLAPADLPKDSGRLDLPIALGILAASGQIDGPRLASYEFAGELSLTGALQPVRGALAMALATRARGHTPCLVLPPGNAEEAALVPGAVVYRAAHLLDVVQHFAPVSSGQGTSQTRANSRQVGGAACRRTRPALPLLAGSGRRQGQAAAKRALEIAAAGGHSLVLVGPPGSGKSMLAQRFAGLLPPMSCEEALESAAIASLCGRFALEHWGLRPTCHPHHSASAVALVEEGHRRGPVRYPCRTMAYCSWMRCPSFRARHFEALREPLETGAITISRAAQRCEFPARFQLIGAMNPCPVWDFSVLQGINAAARPTR